jgi:hypothetical protein
VAEPLGKVMPVGARQTVVQLEQLLAAAARRARARPGQPMVALAEPPLHLVLVEVAVAVPTLPVDRLMEQVPPRLRQAPLIQEMVVVVVIKRSEQLSRVDLVQFYLHLI